MNSLIDVLLVHKEVIYLSFMLLLLVFSVISSLSLRQQHRQQQNADSQLNRLLTLQEHVQTQQGQDIERLYQQVNANHQQSLLQHQEVKHFLEQQFASFQLKLMRQYADQSEKQNQTLHQHQQKFNENQLKAVDQLIDHLTKASQANRDDFTKVMLASSEQMTKKINALTETTDARLKEISHEVEKRLADGFEKTTKTFNDILKRLALIDDAQKKITELSSNVVSLQEVLADKRSRGAFGEVQLTALIRNVLPEQHFALQHTLSNGKIADCILFLPAPTGNVVIDAKFPLESYKRIMDNTLGDHDRKTAQRQFKTDIKKHIKDISSKYLIDKETADGAIMFIPAEAVFAEIHAHHSDLVELSNSQRVWLASPTTLMAILTTMRSVLKDEETRQQIHVIQAHLSHLATDFSRFQQRFDNLAKHIDQAASDVKQIHTSADKITKRFNKIEQVELHDDENKNTLTMT